MSNDEPGGRPANRTARWGRPLNYVAAIAVILLCGKVAGLIDDRVISHVIGGVVGVLLVVGYLFLPGEDKPDQPDPPLDKTQDPSPESS